MASDSATDVTGGVVIEDVTNNTDTQGSQFVWIPVGNVKKANGTTETITLSRYTFDSSGNPTAYGDSSISENDCNFVETNAAEFNLSVKMNGGYYIGRYEARTPEYRSSNKTSGKLTEKADDFVYNYVTQSDATKLCSNMCSNTDFKSALMNSYAWDTAIVYIQKFSGNSRYSQQVARNPNDFGYKGTNNLASYHQDKVCNIWDMASNCFEWTTETNFTSKNPCIRGGVFQYNIGNTSYRNSASNDNARVDYTFRPILYVPQVVV